MCDLFTVTPDLWYSDCSAAAGRRVDRKIDTLQSLQIYGKKSAGKRWKYMVWGKRPTIEGGL